MEELAVSGGNRTALFSPVGVLNAIARSRRNCVVRTAAYGPGRRHRLDVYRPRAASVLAPVVVFFYGGGWEEGERGHYFFIGSALAEYGFVTVVADYRVYPEGLFPAFVEDGAMAVRWVHEHIGAQGGDPDRIVLMGHSAGAHIAALLTFDRQWLGRVSLEPRRALKGMIGLAGPYDFLPLHSLRLKEIFGPEKTLFRSQPINFVDGSGPPAFLATGRSDNTVEPGNTRRLARKIADMGGEATVKVYPLVGHRTIVGALARPLRLLAPVLKDSARFVGEVTSRTSPVEAHVPQREADACLS